MVYVCKQREGYKVFDSSDFSLTYADLQPEGLVCKDIALNESAACDVVSVNYKRDGRLGFAHCLGVSGDKGYLIAESGIRIGEAGIGLSEVYVGVDGLELMDVVVVGTAIDLKFRGCLTLEKHMRIQVANGGISVANGEWVGDYACEGSKRMESFEWGFHTIIDGTGIPLTLEGYHDDGLMLKGVVRFDDSKADFRVTTLADTRKLAIAAARWLL